MPIESYLVIEDLDRYKHIIQYAKDLWAKDTFLHPFFTLHGPHHSEQVSRIIEHILATEHSDHHNIHDIVDPTQLFFLLASAWLHDVGMICSLDDNENKEAKSKGIPIEDWVRDNHHIRSMNYIVNHAEQLRLRSHEATSIGQICLGHRKEKLTELPFSQSYPDNQLLAAILRVADELDITNARTPNQLLELLWEKLDKKSRWHWIKHICVVHSKPNHDEKKDQNPTRLILKYDYIIQLPGPGYLAPFIDIIMKPIKRVIYDENVNLILARQRLGIAPEHFEFNPQYRDMDFPDGTKLHEYLEMQLILHDNIPPKVKEWAEWVDKEIPGIASVLCQICYELIDISSRSVEILTEIKSALDIYMDEIKTSEQLSGIDEAHTNFSYAIRNLISRYDQFDHLANEIEKNGLIFSDIVWRISNIMVGDDAKKASHFQHLVNRLGSDSIYIAEWLCSPEQPLLLRKEGIKALANAGTDRAFHKIFDATKDEDGGIRIEAIKALEQHPGPGTEARLVEIEHHDLDGEVRKTAEDVLHNIFEQKIIMTQEFIGYKVIIADNDNIIDLPLIDLLENRGIQVLLVKNLGPLNNSIKTWNPDVMVIDLDNILNANNLPSILVDQFPEMEYIRAICNNLSSQKPIIVMSDSKPEEIAPLLCTMQAVYIQKPVSVKKITKMIETLLTYSRQVVPVPRQTATVQPTFFPSNQRLLTFKGKIDFAIITIREDEFEAVLKRFSPQPQYIGERRYVIGRVALEGNDYYQVAIARSTDPGEGPAQDLARDMIEQLAPEWLLVVGIAGGIPDDDFTLGDVVVAKRLLDFSVKAISEGKSPEYDVRGWAHPLVEQICAALPAERLKLEKRWNSQESIGVPCPDVQFNQENRFYGDDEWKKKVKDSLTRHFKVPRPPRFTTAVVAATEELTKSPTLVQLWLQDARNIRAVEMELAGVYQAARRVEHQYPVLAIRGISDIVGFKRDPDWTTYACHSAAAFTYELVRSGFIKQPQAPRINSRD